jgi:hypothetical protein
MNEYQKAADMTFKIFGAWWAANLFLDFIKILPTFLSDRIVNALLAKLPI